MAEQKFSLALNAADIPVVTRLQPRPIIIGGMDNRLRNPAVATNSNQDNNPQNFPQVIYCENVIPTPDGGMMSVGYEQVQSAGATTTFDDVYIIRDEDEREWYFCPALGYNYVADNFGDPWVSTNPRPGAPLDANTNRFSIAYVNGLTYICYAKTYIGHWDSATLTFVDDTASLTGVAIADIKFIAGAGNYLLLGCLDSSVKWSSLVNPLDFVPSELTGAGSQIPSDIRGAVSAISPLAGGFLIHCRHNTVAALYTNNSAQPWVFRELKNAGGFLNRAHFSKESSSGILYAFSTYGLQSMGLRESENIQSAASDFLSGRVYETFSPTTKLVTLVEVGNSFNVKVTHVLNRYLVLSYGISTETTYFAALVYDTVLKRWGKLNMTHVDVFSVRSGYAQDSLFYMTSNGTIYRAKLNYSSLADSGVLILGRYQLSRTKQICSQELELEVLHSTESMTVSVAANYNGTTVGQVLPLSLYANTGNYRCFQGQIEGENISYVIEGSFNLVTAIATVTSGARM